MFTDFLEFDEKRPKNNIISTPISEKKYINLLQLSTKRDNIIFTVNNGNESNIESAFRSVPNHIEFLLRRSIRNHIKQVLYPSQKIYRFRLLSKVDIKTLEVNHLSNSTNFVYSITAKFHKYMIHIFQMLSSNVNTEEVDKPTSLKEIMA